MPSIIRSEKDAIDEMIELATNVDRMLSRKPQIDPTREARCHLEDAVKSLSLARDQVRRIVERPKVA